MLGVAGALLGVLQAAAPAGAATKASGFYVTGAGNGHGVGMSQYGAAGYALHGVGYQDILRDYYSGTALGHVDPTQIVTVLLRSGGSELFSGATTIKGFQRKLNPLWNYSVLPVGQRLRVRLGRKLVGTFSAPLQVTGPAPVKLNGTGSYRGALVFRPNAKGNGVMTVNAVGLDDYVQGVVSAEMPSGWPAQALEAQAVAARTYAITSRRATAAFQVYDNTSSQMYGGVRTETPAGNAAVAATSGQVVEYAGAPVATYFFASSGGETESVQNVFSLAPEPWLVGRADPYDNSLNNPYHRWKVTLSLGAAKAKLGQFVEGSLEGIKVVQHGISPRIVKAEVVGTKGTVSVTGVQLRKALGTPSTWMSFTTVSSRGVQTTTTPAGTTTTPTGTSTDTTGTSTTPSGGGPLTRGVERAAAALGDAFSSLRFSTSRYTVTGSVFPVGSGARVTVQFDPGDGWAAIATAKVTGSGRYSVPVADAGSYRVLYNGIAGPEITVG
jgi:stage II sporulation protein D